MSAGALCCRSDHLRRDEARRSLLNGIDSVEVDCAQTTLIVTFLGRAPEWLTPAHLRIEGGKRERDIRVLDIQLERAEYEELDDRLFVTLDRPGDFSTYRLKIVELDGKGRPTGAAPPDFDGRYASADFSFKAGCPQDQDPADCDPCLPPAAELPAIDYLAKDYQSFRRLMLDRLALTAPGWSERHVPDLGITLVELLAYVGDDLSYYQDAVATEAYLGTARQRASVRRHCRLVDYRLHEGCAARTWAAFTLEGAESLAVDPGDLMLTTALPGAPPALLRLEDIAGIPEGEYLVFEPQAGTPPLTLRTAHNRIAFYDWGQSECCLMTGAQSATLLDPGELPKELIECGSPQDPDEIAAGVKEGRWHALKLAAGDVLIFAEGIGPRTGDAADADPMRRHAVRLTSVETARDPLTNHLVVEIAWCPEDALPFPFCLSAISDPPECHRLEGVSFAYGNVVAIDHGRTQDEPLPRVPVAETLARCADACTPAETSYRARAYRPSLRRPDLSFAAPAAGAQDRCGDCGGTAASRNAGPDPVAALPQISLESRLADEAEKAPPHRWSARADLLDSGPDDRHFVVEPDEDGVAILRFGDGRCGRAPAAGERFDARYRAGNGPAGNIGADALAHVVFRNAFPNGVSLAVTNPLAASGGTAPEAMADAKLRAPRRFHDRLERAVAADDYAAIAMRDFPGLVQRAAAATRASGVRIEIEVAIDSRGASDPSPELLACIARHLEAYQRIGHDLRLVPAAQVPIDLALRVCVARGYVAEHVATALRAALGTGIDRMGRPGLFHPDALSFGDGISVSRILAAVHKVDGVAHAAVTRLERLFEGPDGALESGLLKIGPREIARLDQDRNQPENGRIELTMEIER